MNWYRAVYFPGLRRVTMSRAALENIAVIVVPPTIAAEIREMRAKL